MDWYIIIALIKRWRPGSHTFHVPQGECTITLQDVSKILDLPINGVAVSGSTCLDWRVMLYIIRSSTWRYNISRQRLCLSWLMKHLSSLEHDVDMKAMCRYARVVMLQLIRGFLFMDKLNNMVHLMFLQLLEDFKVSDTVTPQTRGSVDYPSTRGIQVDVGLPDTTSENRAESPLYGKLYPSTIPAYTCPKQCNIIPT